MEYLTLTDIYLFTSKDPYQAMSGTFLYAMSAGCPIISNSFVLATEMLDENTGIILKTQSEHELAGHAIRLLENDSLRRQLGHNAFLKTRSTVWKKVGERHAHLFAEILGVTLPSHATSNEFIRKS
jgi:glycosyltransferase involved in cell wall biosynthesis